MTQLKRDVKFTITTSLIVVIIIGNLIFGYYFYSKLSSLEHSIAQTNIELSITNLTLAHEISALNQQTQSQVSSLSDLISSLSKTQTSIQSQLSQIKATTSADFSGIIEDKIKGVVTIKTNAAQGTGFIITSEGFIVTNAHVLSGTSFANIYTYDGNVYSAILIGYNNDIDVALLKIKGTFNALTFGNSDDVKIGQKVIAIGNPLGLSFSVSEGIISAIDRLGINDLPYYFQTDAALNPGNSGGPLIDTAGQVIGINNFKASGAENIGFALESKYAIQAINQISKAKLNSTII